VLPEPARRDPMAAESSRLDEVEAETAESTPAGAVATVDGPSSSPGVPQTSQ
jgi:hypothetical protein